MILLQDFLSPFAIVGYVASIGLILGYVPQALLTIRTRNTDGISLPGFLAMSIGCIAFVIQGLMMGLVNEDGSWPGPGFFIFFTNAITTTCSVIIFCIKMYNDYFKKDRKKDEEK